MVEHSTTVYILSLDTTSRILERCAGRREGGPTAPRETRMRSRLIAHAVLKPKNGEATDRCVQLCRKQRRKQRRRRCDADWPVAGTEDDRYPSFRGTEDSLRRRTDCPRGKRVRLPATPRPFHDHTRLRHAKVRGKTMTPVLANDAIAVRHAARAMQNTSVYSMNRHRALRYASTPCHSPHSHSRQRGLR